MMSMRVRIAVRGQQARPTEIPFERRRVVINVLRERLRQRMKASELAVARDAGRRIQARQCECDSGVVARIDSLPQAAELQRNGIVDLPQQRETSAALAEIVLVLRAGVGVVYVTWGLLLKVAAPHTDTIRDERHVRAGTHAPAEICC